MSDRKKNNYFRTYLLNYAFLVLLVKVGAEVKVQEVMTFWAIIHCIHLGFANIPKAEASCRRSVPTTPFVFF